MALCLAESLVACQGLNARDVMDRFVRWRDHGYLSCTGRCFDIGVTTTNALNRYLTTGDPFAGTPDGAGNGCIMRLAPVPLFHAGDPVRAIETAGESARTTHGAVEALDASRFLAALLVGAVQGQRKEDLLANHFNPTADPTYWITHPLTAKIADIAAGSFKRKEPPAIRGSGYVVNCLEAALWSFYRGRDLADVVLRAANLGDDADTTAAVAGQLAGAYYGIEGIPARWLEKLAWRDKIEALADKLCELAQPGSLRPT